MRENTSLCSIHSSPLCRLAPGQEDRGYAVLSEKEIKKALNGFAVLSALLSS